MEPIYAPECPHIQTNPGFFTLVHHCPIYCTLDQNRLAGQVNIAKITLQSFKGEWSFESAAYRRQLQRYHYARAQLANCENFLAKDGDREEARCRVWKPQLHKCARFDWRQVHKEEAEYRAKERVDRTSPAYVAGAYACASAEEKENDGEDVA